MNNPNNSAAAAAPNSGSVTATAGVTHDEDVSKDDCWSVVLIWLEEEDV